MNALNTYLRTEALKRGMCEKFEKPWQEDYTKEELIENYKKGLDFCIKHDFPSNETIKELFTEEELAEGGVYVDFNGNEAPDSGIYVVQGNSDLTFGSEGFSAHTLYVRHSSRVVLVARNDAFVMVHTYDNAELQVIQVGNAEVHVFNHSKNANITYTGHKVKVKDV